MVNTFYQDDVEVPDNAYLRFYVRAWGYHSDNSPYNACWDDEASYIRFNDDLVWNLGDGSQTAYAPSTSGNGQNFDMHIVDVSAWEGQTVTLKVQSLSEAGCYHTTLVDDVCFSDANGNCLDGEE